METMAWLSGRYFVSKTRFPPHLGSGDLVSGDLFTHPEYVQVIMVCPAKRGRKGPEPPYRSRTNDSLRARQHPGRVSDAIMMASTHATRSTASAEIGRLLPAAALAPPS